MKFDGYNQLIMEYRPLGRTGVKVSALCLGCMMFGGRTSAEDSYAIIDRAIDAGINFLDTANVYSIGNSEVVTGAALKRNGKRARVFLATKVYNVMDDTDPMSFRGTARWKLKAGRRCNGSASAARPRRPIIGARPRLSKSSKERISLASA